MSDHVDWQDLYDKIKASCDQQAEYLLEQLMRPYRAVPGRLLPLPPTQEQLARLHREYQRNLQYIYAPLVKVALMMPPPPMIVSADDPILRQIKKA